MLLTKTVRYYGKEMPVDELSKNSNKKVKVKCPRCNEIRRTHYKSYFRSETDMCQPCTVQVKNTNYLEEGAQYNSLTVLKPAKETGKSVCLCECGNKTIVDNYQIKSGGTKSCGCLKGEHLKHTRKVSGSEHGRWKGGVSTERDRLKESKEYKVWRKSVFERDEYTCQKCGQVGYELNAHHIKPYNQFKELATKKDNGVTFCKECHIKFHSKYGKKDIGKKEVKEFTKSKNTTG